MAESDTSSPSYCPLESTNPTNVFNSNIKRGLNRSLDPSAQDFLDHLGLPLVHPLCAESASSARNRKKNEIHEELQTIGKGVFEIPAFSQNETSSRFSDINKNNPSNLSNADQFLQSTSDLVPPPIIGPISLIELHEGSFYELFLTAATMTAPTLAMAELWVRLFAFFLSPLCVSWMVHREIRALSVGPKKTRKKSKTSNRDENINIAIYLLALASAAVLFTDSLYVFEFGRFFGFSLFMLSGLLAIRFGLTISKRRELKESDKKLSLAQDKKSLFLFATVFLIVITIIVFLRSDGGHAMDSFQKKILSPFSNHMGVDAKYNLKTTNEIKQRHNPLTTVSDPGIDLPTIDPGLYYSTSNPLLASVAAHWPETSRTYDIQNGATPYLLNGDQRTGIPFLVNKVEDQEYVRAWVTNPYDGEILALDIAFPYSSASGDDEPTFAHNLNRPVYLVLHGLNGGSHEEYVKDFVSRRRSEGSTVVVLIARGMMDTLISSGWNVFHGARTGDVDIASRALKRGLDALARAKLSSNEQISSNTMNQPMKRQLLTGVGYSMGAIILSNYVARSGSHCALDAAVAISGGLDMRQQLNFKRSMRLWQPMLTLGLREDILLGKYARYYKQRLTKEQFIKMMRVTSISELDVEAIVNYNSFDDLVHYYSEMSAMGDRYPEFELFDSYPRTNNKSWGRIGNVSIPFVVLQALDDPLVGWRTIGTESPQELVESGSGHLMLLLTKAGGHVGWPLGTNPKSSGWKWMNDAAKDFAIAVNKARSLGL